MGLISDLNPSLKGLSKCKCKKSIRTSGLTISYGEKYNYEWHHPGLCYLIHIQIGSSIRISKQTFNDHFTEI